jgi:hypothetical protein
MPASRTALWSRLKGWTIESIRRVSQDTSSSSHTAVHAAPADVGQNACRSGQRVLPRSISDRKRMWRRRSLLRKGARLSSSMGRSSALSVAILDAEGIIIDWNEPTRDLGLPEPRILQRHVSELYVAEDRAAGIPAKDLCDSTAHGSSTQYGWRRGSDGVLFWAMTVIAAMRLRDGTVQGYSYVTRRKPIPWSVSRPASAGLPQL